MISARETELWALRILDAVQNRSYREDALVELKREISDDQKIARRIAAHCNAARGDTVLWIIGADEVQGVTGWNAPDLADLLPQLWRYFDCEPPSCCGVSLNAYDKACTALAFHANRPPYLVKNASFGKDAGHVIASEIPWRDGTRTRTAKRDEVIRLLIDHTLAPDVEVFDGTIHELSPSAPAKAASVTDVRLMLSLEFYVMPRTPEPVVIPHHRIRLSFSDVGRESTTKEIKSLRIYSKEGRLGSIGRMLRRARTQAIRIESEPDNSIKDTGTELIILRAAHVLIELQLEFPHKTWTEFDRYTVELGLYAGFDKIPILLTWNDIAKRKAGLTSR